MVEARLGRERRDGAAVVGGDGAPRVADQEGEVKLVEEREGDDGRVGDVAGVAIGGSAVGLLGGGCAVGVGVPEGRGDAGGLVVGREQVVGNVLDEEAFPL